MTEEKAKKLAQKYSKNNIQIETPKGQGMRKAKQLGKGGKPKNTRQTAKRLLAYLSVYKLKLVFVFICVVLSASSNLYGSYMLRPIINNFIAPINGSGNPQALAKSLVIMALAYVIGVIASYLQAKIMIGVSQNALQAIRNDLFSKVQKLPIKFYDTHNHGELMSRFTNDVDTIGEMLNNTVVQLFSGVISIIGTLAIMFYTNIYLAVITILFIPLITKAGSVIASKSSRYFSAQQSAIGAVNGYIEETVTGQKVVKVFCHEESCIDEFSFLNDDLKKKQIKAQFFGSIMGPVMHNISQINYSITAAVGGILCIMGKFDVGGITIFLNFSRQFSRPINEISMQMTNIFSALAGAERVFDIMNKEPEPKDRENAVELNKVKGEVVLKNVTFGYTDDTNVLKNISLYAKAGQKIAFVGSTGAGKTTITNLLNRFYDIKEGNITIDGVDIKDIKKDSLRSHIAMVLQDTHLFTGTVMENIRYGRLDATDDEVIQAAKTASAHSFIKRLPNGYDTMLEGDGANLSQGQRQLINIARAAVSKAPILILDEATSSVDTRTERLIDKGMDRLMADRTTFVIAHRLSTVRNANAIMVLENGEIIERGDHDDLLKNKGRYYNLYTGLVELD